MANVWEDLVGTVNDRFALGLSGNQIKHVAGAIQARNNADSAFVDLIGELLKAAGDDIELNYDASGSGADRKYVIRRPSSGMTEALTLILPAVNGTDGQVLAKKAGSGAGIIELEWVSLGGTANKRTVDTTTLNHNSSSPLSMFTLPANNRVFEARIIIVTAFNGNPSMSVGVSGDTSKYVGATQVDLKKPAGTVFVIRGGTAAAGSAENLIITYAASGATA
ncbi:MAG: hypothetical protein N2045_13680, partial [Fimbriimonadales bacterium]|nr:hypothetical protein [Fimbriimonadales bacterium]